MGYVFLIAFVLVSALHLYASIKCNKKLRAQSKGFILLALLGWYCCSVDNVSWIVIVALLTSWLGDVLLIPPGVKWFTIGGISFMISHFFFALVYYPHIDFQAVPDVAIVLIAFVYTIAVCLEFKGLKPFLKKALFYPMFLYLLINGTMNSFAWFQMITNPCKATIVTLIGALLFFCSDSILFFVRFNKETRWKSHFPVMLTYIIGEFLIVLGIIMYS